MSQPVSSGPPPPVKPRPITWVDKLTAILVCVFCFEVGAFLLVYPWMNAWNENYLLQINSAWTPFLLSQQFRGAISGLGMLNIFIAISEVFRLRRFAARSVQDTPSQAD